MTEYGYWVSLLRQWKELVQGLYGSNENKWKMLGLPDIREMEITPPDNEGIDDLLGKFDIPDQEIVRFYETTDGWPLWLGSKSCYILPTRRVDHFRNLYIEAFMDAVEYCFDERIVEEHGEVHLSRDDFEDALVVSGPDAREFVLLLRSGEICLFQYDWAMLFDDFYAFMKYRHEKLSTVLHELLS